MIKASLFAIIATPNSCTIDKQLNDTSCFPISTIETFYYRQKKIFIINTEESAMSYQTLFCCFTHLSWRKQRDTESFSSLGYDVS